ncbi:acyl-CoA thioesterase [Diaphorobacter caeni]|uniref:acyl-CoA thioesterase n=1 Tax=Diaphorobacter caeni TaxID=2784387 RepID=UPI00188FEC1F|nr:thioesterase family protein [Diaphorobacter caeni]MBF5002634.1 thioesterase family protein [Diaphorobacter caeni]
MARIIFDLPDHFAFSTEVQIYISHVNQGGHLDNAQLLSLVSEARLRFFQEIGFPEADLPDISMVVGDIVAQYKSEGFHGEVMLIRMTPADFNRYGFDLVFSVTEKSQGREVARGKTGVAFVSKSSRGVVPIPEATHRKLLAMQRTA